MRRSIACGALWCLLAVTMAPTVKVCALNCLCTEAVVYCAGTCASLVTPSMVHRTCSASRRPKLASVVVIAPVQTRLKLETSCKSPGYLIVIVCHSVTECDCECNLDAQGDANSQTWISNQSSRPIRATTSYPEGGTSQFVDRQILPKSHGRPLHQPHHLELTWAASLAMPLSVHVCLLQLKSVDALLIHQ